ncbi:MAG: phosphate ABC transporter permease subunit PstC [Alphaproteobacteria bacterium]|nr:MAG: phosphate ABC transporter permease subunit PstC [Alphaproteobacteria bacterium]
MTLYAILVFLAAAVLGYVLNAQAARQIRTADGPLHSIPKFHGMYAFLLVAIPSVLLLGFWLLFQNSVVNALALAAVPDDIARDLDDTGRALLISEIRSIAFGRVFGEPEPWKLDLAERMRTLDAMSDRALIGVMAMLSAGLLLFARSRVSAAFRARQRVERMISGLMIFCSLVAIFTTFGIVASLVTESIRFFDKVPLTEFLFGLNWEPQIPLREDQVAAEGAFGWIPVFVGTLVITAVALTLAVPVGLFAAIYLNEFASPRLRAVAKPLLEILAGVPTVVYGFFAVLVVAPAIRAFGAYLGIPVSPNTALAAGSVMGVMLIPFISSFADDALSAVPRGLRDGSLALGATQGETVMKVLFPAAIPGIVGGILLAVSRAIGETMIVVMAAGLIAKLTFNPLDSVTTVTVQIVTLLIGDTSFDNPKTLAAFALGLMLFLVTLGINIIALRVVRKYRELYD